MEEDVDVLQEMGADTDDAEMYPPSSSANSHDFGCRLLPNLSSST